MKLITKIAISLSGKMEIDFSVWIQVFLQLIIWSSCFHFAVKKEAEKM